MELGKLEHGCEIFFSCHFRFLFGVKTTVRGDGATIGKGERVSRTILRFIAFFSTAFILKGIYFHENRKTEKPGHPALPKSVFFLTHFPETVQSKRSAGQ
jgi:hypothetical protein